MNMNRQFPPDFTWGVATAAFQIEGATHEDGRGASIWDTFCATPGKVKNGDTGEVACDHYHRWQSDLDLIKSLNVGAYRFSVAWPRILPDGVGSVNQKGLDFYDRLVDGLLARGLEPHLTLYHWDLPQALQDEGGWVSRDIVDAFVNYADMVTSRLGDRVRAYTTLNEPWCSAMLGHYLGEHAPGFQDRKKALQAAHHLLLAHGAALSVMRENAPGAQHGVVLNFTPSYPASGDPQDERAARLFDGFFNRWFLEPLVRGAYPEDMWEVYGADVPEIRADDLERISAPLDFLGVNYYSRAVMAYDPDGEPPRFKSVSVAGEHTDMGWEVFPQGLTDLLVRLSTDYPNLPPLLITENGAAYPDVLGGGEVQDEARIRYLKTHLEAVAEAVERGADVRGYFAWSLLDNFEWAFGYSKRFGLIYTDYETLERIPKASAKWYAETVAVTKEGIV